MAVVLRFLDLETSDEVWYNIKDTPFFRWVLPLCKQIHLTWVFSEYFKKIAIFFRVLVFFVKKRSLILILFSRSYFIYNFHIATDEFCSPRPFILLLLLSSLLFWTVEVPIVLIFLLLTMIIGQHDFAPEVTRLKAVTVGRITRLEHTFIIKEDSKFHLQASLKRKFRFPVLFVLFGARLIDASWRQNARQNWNVSMHIRKI